jgi:hypothetical protein
MQCLKVRIRYLSRFVSRVRAGVHVAANKPVTRGIVPENCKRYTGGGARSANAGTSSADVTYLARIIIIRPSPPVRGELIDVSSWRDVYRRNKSVRNYPELPEFAERMKKIHLLASYLSRNEYALSAAFI